MYFFLLFASGFFQRYICAVHPYRCVYLKLVCCHLLWSIPLSELLPCLGRLGNFHLGAVMNGAALTILMRVFRWICVHVSVGYTPRTRMDR